MLALLAVAVVTLVEGSQSIGIQFQSVDYQHRWSQGGQHEFTPEGQADLTAWTDMLTINLHEQATTPEELAVVASRILDLYGTYGRVLRTDAVPPTDDAGAAEYFVAAVLADPGFLEAVFARMMLRDGVAHVVVYSHRHYGADVGAEMSAWLRDNGPQLEETLMAWDSLPTLAILRGLPRAE